MSKRTYSVFTHEALSELLKKQMVLDQHILDKHNLAHIDTYRKRELAFIIELSEFVNDMQSFKFWKLNNEPKETMLEEFIDALHFALSLSTDLIIQGSFTIDEIVGIVVEQSYDLSDMYNDLNELLFDMYSLPNYKEDKFNYLSYLLVVTKFFDFTLNDYLEAYQEKNKVNFERQKNDY